MNSSSEMSFDSQFIALDSGIMGWAVIQIQSYWPMEVHPTTHIHVASFFNLNHEQFLVGTNTNLNGFSTLSQLEKNALVLVDTRI